MFLKEGHQTLLICSSNAMKPQLRELDALSLEERSSPENVIGVCSAHVDLNTTAVLVGKIFFLCYFCQMSSVNRVFCYICYHHNVWYKLVCV